MQSYIETSGYGYSKWLCQDVAAWFLNEYLGRYNIQLHILHRGLKREHAYGYCDFVDKHYRPREFLIELDTYMNEDLYIKTLLHELTHLRQWVKGTLQLKAGKLCYNGNLIDTQDYHSQPHEIEAHEQEQILYEKYRLYKLKS
jgi:hypothetical protein